MPLNSTARLSALLDESAQRGGGRRHTEADGEGQGGEADENGLSARVKVVAGAADMISRRGLNATSFRELAKHAKAPIGSTYHYFPNGKQQLATEAVQYAGTAIARALSRELTAGPLAGLRGFTPSSTCVPAAPR